jgi:myo-inositol-1(or 4)-monophosphatase
MIDSSTVARARALSDEAGIAAEAARRGGDVLLRYWRKLQSAQIHEKGKGDLVTEADVASEAAIAEFLQREMPEAALVSEEGTDYAGTRRIWYVDPLDGTTNFVQKFPVFAVSVALAETADKTRAELCAGAVLNPISGDFFYGSRDKGSCCGADRLHVSLKSEIGDAVLATGFPRRHHSELPVYLKEFEKIFRACRGIRRAGAAALDLCWTAQGIYDGFWEHHLSPWDIAAGTLIMEEAGGVCSDFDGRRAFLQSGDIIGAAPAIYGAMRNLIQEARSAMKE